MSVNPIAVRSGRAKTALVVAATAGSLLAGAGIAAAAPVATAHTKAAAKTSVKLATKSARGRTRVAFVLSGKVSQSKKSWWSVDFGDKYSVTGKKSHPARVWHVFGSAGTYNVKFTNADATGHKTVTAARIRVTAPAAGATLKAGDTAAVGGTVNVTYTVIFNGHPVKTSALSATASASATATVTTSTPAKGRPVTQPTTAPTAAPTTTAAPTAAPTTPIVTVSPNPIPPLLQFALGLNPLGLLNGTLLNFTAGVSGGTGATSGYLISWGDGTTTAGVGPLPTNPTHTYSSIGVKTVTVTINTIDNQTVSVNLPILVV